MGSKTAPIKMEVFSDYQCPACRELYLQTVRPVIENYVATGKVYLVHRDFPLQGHKYAREAARWANAAAHIGRFERVVDAIYTKQDLWSTSGDLEGIVASVLTPNEMRRARQALKGGNLDTAIDKDLSMGNFFKVRQTPTTIITHRGQTYPITGVMSYSLLRRFLEDLLKQG
jgi:protein-disulfide isomerase